MTQTSSAIVAVVWTLHLMDFNNTTLLLQFKHDLGWSIDYITLWTYTKKGYIKPSSYMKDGKRKVPIYYFRDYPLIVATLQGLANLGKIRIKGYDKSTKRPTKERSQT